MSWLKTANAVLEKSTGLRLAKAKRPPVAGPVGRSGGKVADGARPPAEPEHDRLLEEPVFVFSGPRSGSTLLRVVLNSHSLLCAPHETHVRTLHVRQSSRTGAQAMAAFGHNRADVEHLLWDRVLHRELLRSGKRTLVEKTPSNVFVSGRIATCWPDARFIVLLRHPYSMALSWHEGEPETRPMECAVAEVLKYAPALERTRRERPHLAVRYEQLTADPEGETRRICEYLGVPWEASMLDYGTADHGAFSKGLGDWKDKIRSGSIQQGRPLPTEEETPEVLRPLARSWGYLD